MKSALTESGSKTKVVKPESYKSPTVLGQKSGGTHSDEEQNSDHTVSRQQSKYFEHKISEPVYSKDRADQDMLQIGFYEGFYAIKKRLGDIGATMQLKQPLS